MLSEGLSSREQSQNGKKATRLFFQLTPQKAEIRRLRSQDLADNIKILGFWQVPNLLNFFCITIPNISRETLIKTNKMGVLYVFGFPPSPIILHWLIFKTFPLW